MAVIGYMPDILYAPELDYLGEIEPGLRATVRSSSILAQRRMIASGAGVGVLPCFLAADDDALVRVRLDQTIGRSFRSEEHTSELQSLMRISYAVFCLKKKKINIT